MEQINYRSIKRKAKGIINIHQMSKARRRGQRRWWKNKIRTRLNHELYRLVYHETGHYIVRDVLKPGIEQKIILKKNAKGKWIGETRDLNHDPTRDTPDIVGKISIAGAVAETSSANEAYSLLKSEADLEADYIYFQRTQGILRSKLVQRGIISEKQYFDFLYDQISRILTKSRRLFMDRLACATLIEHDLPTPK